MHRILTLVIFVFAASCAVIAPKVMAGEFTIAAMTGPMLLGDLPGDPDDPTNGGIVLGYELGIVLADLAVEADFTKTLDKGNNESEVDTAGLYLALRTPGPIYFKVRGGFVSWDYSDENSSSDDSGTSYGLGIGFSLALLQIELDYTTIDDDINFVSLGIRF
ncbi:MAG: hypothetical protein GXP08_09825 [Gammaproteobacteria bacterium]|nr:hypothetical protein [Gammaproteobacteria bacterium]